ncbi:MAG: hypothetical protein HY744_17545 [Deltaproteobacteria bacterium]|nr:hypothetical protein [Deltaproteobacteria bacterium]
MLLPFAALALATRCAAVALAERSAGALSQAAAQVAPASRPDPAPAPPARTSGATAPSDPEALSETPGRSVSASRAAASPGGVLVRARRTQAAIDTGMRPTGSAAPASGPRPAGLVLHGIGVLGVGVRDGDVVTSVGGTPATSEGAIVRAVAGALYAGARGITAELWRGEQRFPLTVEFPVVREGNRWVRVDAKPCRPVAAGQSTPVPVSPRGLATAGNPAAAASSAGAVLPPCEVRDAAAEARRAAAWRRYLGPRAGGRRAAPRRPNTAAPATVTGSGAPARHPPSS